MLHKHEHSTAKGQQKMQSIAVSLHGTKLN